jgi:hypothetical protein
MGAYAEFHNADGGIAIEDCARDALAKIRDRMK